MIIIFIPHRLRRGEAVVNTDETHWWPARKGLLMARWSPFSAHKGLSELGLRWPLGGFKELCEFQSCTVRESNSCQLFLLSTLTSLWATFAAPSCAGFWGVAVDGPSRVSWGSRLHSARIELVTPSIFHVVVMRHLYQVVVKKRISTDCSLESLIKHVYWLAGRSFMTRPIPPVQVWMQVRFRVEAACSQVLSFFPLSFYLSESRRKSIRNSRSVKKGPIELGYCHSGNRALGRSCKTEMLLSGVLMTSEVL